MAPSAVAVLEERTVESPQLTLLAALQPSSINVEARTVEVVFYSGAPMERFDWESGRSFILTLSLEASAVRLDRLNDGAPLLDAHGSYSVRDQVGVIEEGTAKVGRKATATVRFSKRADVEPIWQDVRDGIIRNVSVGARIYKYEQTEPTESKPMKRLATDWEPFEISLVPIGADPGAHVRAADNAPKNRCIAVLCAAQEDRPMNPTTAAADNSQGTGTATDHPEQPNPTNVQATAGDPGAPTGDPQPGPVVDTAAAAGTVAERNRVDRIMTSVFAVGLPVELAQDLIRRGLTIEAAQAVVIEEVSRRGGPTAGPQPGRTGARIGVDQHDHVRAGITSALLNRVAPQFFELDATGRLYRGRSVLQLAEYFLQSLGVRTTHMSRGELFAAAFELKAAGLHTTSDFPNILGDVANKTLRRAYDEAPQTFGVLITRKELVDFKPVRRTQVSEAPELRQVLEHGEIEHGSMGDAKEQYQLATYARQFGLSRQAIINDDTNAFGSLALQFGRMARQKESDLVWAQITGNPTMGDGVALFHASHGNISGSAGAIAIDTIGVGRTKMRQQKGLVVAGETPPPLNLTPLYLIVPTALETVADQFVSTALLAAQASNVNPFGGKLTVIAEPRLDDASASVWYLAASTTQVDMIELGFLSGQMGPAVTSRFGWDVDGLEVKVVHDVTAKVIDHRGFFRNAA